MKDGWKASLIQGYDHCRVFSAPNNDGHVTVDYDRRGWRIGISSHGLTFPAKDYKGRGWRERLEYDAMEYLGNVLYGHDAAGDQEESK